jgi:Toprim domain
MSVLSYATLANLCESNIGTNDVPCPLCGPDRRSPENRKRRVLRIWHQQPGFTTYCCQRCGAQGYARADGGGGEGDHRRVRRQSDSRGDGDHAARQLDKARWLWRRRKPLENSPAETYSRKVRAYGGAFPATLGSLPSCKPEHHPALIAAFGLADELEPGLLSISDDQVRGVHLTLLRPDGSGKAGTGRDKLMVGSSSGWPIVLAPINDLLGLIICEGIETGLSLAEATGCGVWAAGSAGWMPLVADKVPTYVDCVSIAAEADPAGQKGATELAQRLEVRGIYCELRILGGQEAQAA